ncbi:MAG: hypothetical protein K2M10_03135 [Muribaculaceae bacterium]|nr:hypothetical protein [Muribaculaceae bacterium]
MEIPRTEKEFIKDILDNCHNPTTLTHIAFYKNLGIINPDNIKYRIVEYGVTNPNIPKRWSDENTNDYIAKIWNINAYAILEARGLTIEDRNVLIGTSVVDHPRIRKWLIETEESEEWNNGWFTRLPYHERKFITPVKSFDDYRAATPDIIRFRISHIPADVKFEDCIPTVGELYIAHPYRPGIYLPLSKYEHLIFRERIHELSKVMLALGATEIKTVQNSGYKSHSESEHSSRTSGSASFGGKFGATGSYSHNDANEFGTEREDAIVINFKNDPYNEPYIPDGLIWYPHEREWQQIAENRLHGNFLEYEIRISSKKINLISDLERSNIGAQARLLFASGSFSRETSSKSFFKEETAKSTSILIKFKPRKNSFDNL